MNIHEHYEELCALAVSGQASQDELTDLGSHLEACADCRSTAYEFTQVSAQRLSQLAAERLECKIPAGMTQRFVARARSEGIELTRENMPPAPAANHRWTFAAMGAVGVLLIAGFGSLKPSPVTVQNRPVLVNPATASSSSSVSEDSRTEDEEANIARVRQQLAAARSEMKFVSATIQGTTGRD